MKSINEKLLAALAIKYEGSWDPIYKDVVGNVSLSDEEIDFYLDQCKSDYITVLDPKFPVTLKQVYKPPFVLFYHGDISLLYNIDKLVSVIGTRVPTEYGEKVTYDIVSELCKSKIIVSGLAKGIDGMSHQITINNGGKTIAVLGSGINYPYPSENIDLYNEIKKNHLVISEYPNSLAPKPYYFLLRNRIIAGIGKGVLVTEAIGKTSGTLVTVRFGLNIGKDIMCVPSHIYSDSVCNKLIKKGAFLVENAQDVIDVVDI